MTIFILTSKSPVSAISGLGSKAIWEEGTGAGSSTTCSFSSTIGTGSRTSSSSSSGLYVRRSR